MKWFLLCLLIPTITFAQEETPEVIEFYHPEPQFVGGFHALRDFISEHLEYPQQAIEKDIEGKVYVQFMVESDGSLSEIEIVRSVNPILDAEVVRIISIMPNWEPMEHNGEPIRMSVRLPVTFTLSDEEDCIINDG